MIIHLRLNNDKQGYILMYGRNYPTEEIIVSDVPLYFDEPLQEELIIPNVITPNGGLSPVKYKETNAY